MKYLIKTYATLLSICAVTLSTQANCLAATDVKRAADEKMIVGDNVQDAAFEKFKTDFTGKTLWFKNYTLHTYDSATKTYDIIETNDLKFKSVTVTSIEPSGTRINPVRIFYKVDNGQSGYVDVDINESADYKEVSFTPVNKKIRAERRIKITDFFYLENPIVKYHLTPQNINAVHAGKIYIGMSKTVLTLIKGEPSSINYTTTGSSRQEQWVYDSSFGNTSYYYFTNGKLTTVQN